MHNKKFLKKLTAAALGLGLGASSMASIGAISPKSLWENHIQNQSKSNILQKYYQQIQPELYKNLSVRAETDAAKLLLDGKIPERSNDQYLNPYDAAIDRANAILDGRHLDQNDDKAIIFKDYIFQKLLECQAKIIQIKADVKNKKDKLDNNQVVSLNSLNKYSNNPMVKGKINIINAHWQNCLYFANMILNADASLKTVQDWQKSFDSNYAEMQNKIEEALRYVYFFDKMPSNNSNFLGLGSISNNNSNPFGFGNMSNNNSMPFGFGNISNNNSNPLSFGNTPNNNSNLFGFGNISNNNSNPLAFGNTPNNNSNLFGFGNISNNNSNPFGFGNISNNNSKPLSFGNTSNNNSMPFGFGNTSNNNSNPLSFANTSNNNSNPFGFGNTSNNNSNPFGFGNMSNNSSNPLSFANTSNNNSKPFGFGNMSNNISNSFKSNNIPKANSNTNQFNNINNVAPPPVMIKNQIDPINNAQSKKDLEERFKNLSSGNQQVAGPCWLYATTTAINEFRDRTNSGSIIKRERGDYRKYGPVEIAYTEAGFENPLSINANGPNGKTYEAILDYARAQGLEARNVLLCARNDLKFPKDKLVKFTADLLKEHFKYHKSPVLVEAPWGGEFHELTIAGIVGNELLVINSFGDSITWQPIEKLSDYCKKDQSLTLTFFGDKENPNSEHEWLYLSGVKNEDSLKQVKNNLLKFARDDFNMKKL